MKKSGKCERYSPSSSLPWLSRATLQTPQDPEICGRTFRTFFRTQNLLYCPRYARRTFSVQKCSPKSPNVLWRSLSTTEISESRPNLLRGTFPFTKSPRMPHSARRTIITRKCSPKSPKCHPEDILDTENVLRISEIIHEGHFAVQKCAHECSNVRGTTFHGLKIFPE